MISFQEKALQEREDRIFTETYLKNKKYDKIFFRLGIILILILCAVVGYAYLKPKKQDTLYWTVNNSQDHIVGYYNQIVLSRPGIPKTLRINGQQWILIPAKGILQDSLDDRNWSAYTDCDNQYIVYKPDYQGIKDALWHEVFHAGGCIHGNGKVSSGDKWWNSEHPDDNNHPGIYHLGHFMKDFTEQNTDFIEWEEND